MLVVNKTRLMQTLIKKPIKTIYSSHAFLIIVSIRLPVLWIYKLLKAIVHIKTNTGYPELEYEQLEATMHPRNPHKNGYDFAQLAKAYAPLSAHLSPKPDGKMTIDFAHPAAVKSLNAALLSHYYQVHFWDIPEGYLCPPIPGRADYIHHISDILAGSNFGNMPTGPQVTCLDIGTGANCIYPIIGRHEYGWSFIGSDIDKNSIEAAQKIVDSNENLKGHVELRLQEDAKDIFYGVLRKEEVVDLTVCNPPFHASAEAAEEASLRKVNNLNRKQTDKAVLNFGGTHKELWTEGGERRFIRDMVRESKKFENNCFWFSTLVSKEVNLKGAREALDAVKAKEIKVIPMGQGNKSSRIIAWTFLTAEQQKEWKNARWQKSAVPNS